MQWLNYLLLLLVVVPTNFLFYKFFKKKTKLSKTAGINITGILSILFWAIGYFLIAIVPSSLQGRYASSGGDLTILPIILICFYTITFMFVYMLGINIGLFILKLKKKQTN